MRTNLCIYIYKHGLYRQLQISLKVVNLILYQMSTNVSDDANSLLTIPECKMF